MWYQWNKISSENVKTPLIDLYYDMDKPRATNMFQKQPKMMMKNTY